MFKRKPVELVGWETLERLSHTTSMDRNCKEYGIADESRIIASEEF